MRPRTRTRWGEAPPPPPPPPPPAGRYRRRSPAPADSPRHYRRGREPPRPPAGGGGGRRRSPERPRRPEKCLSDGGGARRSKAEILLEAGRLAAEYLMSKGLLPEQALPGKGTEPQGNGDAGVGRGYRKKRSDADNGDIGTAPRWRRNGRGGDWSRDEEKMPRRLGWDKRSYSSNGRYDDGGDGLEPGRRRRSHEFTEFRSRSMSRISRSSDRDRRTHGDVGRDVEALGKDRKRRSRSRSYFEGGQRDPVSRVDGADLECGELRDDDKLLYPDEISRALDDGQDDMDCDSDPVNAFRVSKRPCSLVMKMTDNADQRPASEPKNTLLDGSKDASDAKNDDNNGAVLINSNADGIDITEQPQPDANVPHLSEPADEPVDQQCELWNVETESITGSVQGVSCSVEPATENSAREEQNHLLKHDLAASNCCPRAEDVMETAEAQAETDADISSRDEKQRPASYRIFDLNLVEAEMSEVAGDPDTDHSCNSQPGSIGGGDLQMTNGTSEAYCIDGHAVDNHHLDNGQMTYGHAADNGHMKNWQMITDGQAADNHHLHNGLMIPIINLEDDCEEQYDAEKISGSKSKKLHKCMDGTLPEPEHTCSQDQHTSSFSNPPHTNISFKPNIGNLRTGKGTFSAQGVPSDDDVLYVGLEKIPLELINVWDLPSSELGESL